MSSSVLSVEFDLGQGILAERLKMWTFGVIAHHQLYLIDIRVSPFNSAMSIIPKYRWTVSNWKGCGICG
jgi:hypothetical protein